MNRRHTRTHNLMLEKAMSTNYTLSGAILLAATALTTLVLNNAALAGGSPDTIWEVQGHTHTVNAVAFSPDGQTVASGADYTDSTAKIWDAADGTLLQTFPPHSWGVVSVDFSPDGQLLAVGHVVAGYPPGGRVVVWDIAEATELDTFGGCYAAFSPDGELLASGGGGPIRDVYVHRVSDGEEIAQIYTGSYVTAVAFSPDSQVIASGGSDNVVRLWDAYTGAPIRTLVGHTDNISALAFSPDGQILASGAGGFDEPSDSTIKLWQVSDGTLLRTLDGHNQWGRVTAAA